MFKQCSRCLILLPLENFSPRKGSTDGLNGHCKNCLHQKTKEWKLNNPIAYLCSNMLAQAKRRACFIGREFNLTHKDLLSLVVPRCPILGTDLVWEYCHGMGLGDHSPSLDRIDNSLGYVKGNVAIISHRANSLKNSATTEELKAILAYMKKPPQPPKSCDTVPRQYGRMTDENRLMILRLSKEGKTCREIAKVVNLSKSSVAAFIKGLEKPLG